MTSSRSWLGSSSTLLTVHRFQIGRWMAGDSLIVRGSVVLLQEEGFVGSRRR